MVKPYSTWESDNSLVVQVMSAVNWPMLVVEMAEIIGGAVSGGVWVVTVTILESNDVLGTSSDVLMAM